MHSLTAAVAADALAHNDLPDWEEFDTAAWAVQDTLDRIAEGEA